MMPGQPIRPRPALAETDSEPYAAWVVQLFSAPLTAARTPPASLLDDHHYGPEAFPAVQTADPV